MFLQGFFGKKRNFLSAHASHASHHEIGIHDTDKSGNRIDFSLGAENRFIIAGRLSGGFDFFFVVRKMKIMFFEIPKKKLIATIQNLIESFLGMESSMISTARTDKEIRGVFLAEECL